MRIFFALLDMDYYELESSTYGEIIGEGFRFVPRSGKKGKLIKETNCNKAFIKLRKRNRGFFIETAYPIP